AACAERRLPVIHDVGSGLFVSLEPWGLSGEPLATDAVRSGATVVTMSGDKLLGGPQAGIALGSGEAIQRMRRNPLTRALRVDKLTLAALEATLALYRDPPRAMREIPTLAMLSAPISVLEGRAAALCSALGRAGHASTVVASEGSVGGGAFPTTPLPSVAVALEGDPEELDERLRTASQPVIGRIVDGRLRLELRSVPEGDDAGLAESVIAALS
ncbi:MAG TPA: hypothetical protein VIQ74_08990, partial [Gemmatimonadaceae bacterium]